MTARDRATVRGASARGRLRVLVLAAALGSIAVGCGPAVQNITITSSAPVAPVAGQATIVIIQPTTGFQSVNILDARGQLLGQLNGRSRTVVHVPPGAVRLYAIPEKQAGWGDRIDGTVRAGRIYYATISLRYGGVAFRVLNPQSRDNRWAHRDEFMAKTPPVEMDSSKLANAMRQIGDPAPLLKR